MNIIEIDGTSDVEKDSANIVLKQIQNELDVDNDTSITDIWSVMSPLTYFVAFNDGSPVAVLTLVGCDESPEIFKIYVCKQYRQQSVGMKLFQHVEKKLIREGINKVFVEIIDGYSFWKNLSTKYCFEQLDDEKYFIKLNG